MKSAHPLDQSEGPLLQHGVDVWVWHPAWNSQLVLLLVEEEEVGVEVCMIMVMVELGVVMEYYHDMLLNYPLGLKVMDLTLKVQVVVVEVVVPMQCHLLKNLQCIS